MSIEDSDSQESSSNEIQSEQQIKTTKLTRSKRQIKPPKKIQEEAPVKKAPKESKNPILLKKNSQLIKEFQDKSHELSIYERYERMDLEKKESDKQRLPDPPELHLKESDFEINLKDKQDGENLLAHFILAQTPSMSLPTSFYINTPALQLYQTPPGGISASSRGAEQMGKVAFELIKRNQVKSNKSQIQQQEEMEIKSIHQNIVKKMQQHNQKREKVFSQKASHFKLLDQNWRLKLEEIQRKKKQQYRKSLEKAAQYRKEAETFWSSNRKKQRSMVIDNTIPVVENQGYFSIRSDFKRASSKLIKPYGEVFYQNKKKSQSKNQFPSTVKSLLPTIDKKNYFLSKRGTQKTSQNEEKTQMHQSYHKPLDEKAIQEHIEKSKNLSSEKQAMALQKALEKMKQIELKRKKCKLDRQKNIKQARIKRQLRQETIANAQKSRRQDENYPVKSSKQKRSVGKSRDSPDFSLSRSRSKRQVSLSLKESIVKHQKAKESLQAQKFQERGEVMKANIMKQKKGKMIRMVKETINKLKYEALKDV